MRLILKMLAVALASGVLVGCPNGKGRSRLTSADKANPANARFLETFAKEDNWYSTPMFGRTNEAWPAFAVMQNADGHPDKMIVIAFYAPPDPGQPPMQIMLFARREGPLAGDYGNPVVVADLTNAQSDSVFTHGVPPSLVAEMTKTAEGENWQPIVKDGEVLKRVFIEPAKHFQKSE